MKQFFAILVWLVSVLPVGWVKGSECLRHKDNAPSGEDLWPIQQ